MVRVVLSDTGEDVVGEFRLRSSEAVARSLADWSQGESDQMSWLLRRAIESVDPGLAGVLDT